MTHQDMMATNLRAGVQAIKRQRLERIWTDALVGPLWFSVTFYERGFDTALSEEDREAIKARERENDRRAAAALRKLRMADGK